MIKDFDIFNCESNKTETYLTENYKLSKLPEQCTVQKYLCV